MQWNKRAFRIDKQWNLVYIPEKPNGFAVLIIGDTNHYVNDETSLWEQQEGRRRLLDALLIDGYTVFTSHLYGKHWGNPDSCALAKQVTQYVMRHEILNWNIHLLAEGMGALTALELAESDFPVRSAALLNPCLDLNVFLTDVRESRWFYKQLLQQISEAYEIPVPAVRKMVEHQKPLQAYQAGTPVKIWHPTTRTVYPFHRHSRPYEQHRARIGSPITLLLHMPERQFNCGKEISLFFREHENIL